MHSWVCESLNNILRCSWDSVAHWGQRANVFPQTFQALQQTVTWIQTWEPQRAFLSFNQKLNIRHISYDNVQGKKQQLRVDALSHGLNHKHFDYGWHWIFDFSAHAFSEFRGDFNATYSLVSRTWTCERFLDLITDLQDLPWNQVLSLKLLSYLNLPTTIYCISHVYSLG